MKIGIIRCQMTEDYCPGTTCFKYLAGGKGAFAGTEDAELVGFTSCGGCPGKKIPLKAELLKKRGAETIVLASCITKGTPIGYPCPFADKLEEQLRGNAEGLNILTYTH